MKAKINIGDKVRLNDEYGTTAIVERITGVCLTVKCQNGYDFWSVHDVTVVQTKEDIELNNDKEMKLKDLLKGRERLRKYDELKEWRTTFELNNIRVFATVENTSDYSFVSRYSMRNQFDIAVDIPDRIKQIILAAIDAELKKMEEE